MLQRVRSAAAILFSADFERFGTDELMDVEHTYSDAPRDARRVGE
jgi:hypothetical protein